MLIKILDRMFGLVPTLVGGVFLLMSLIFSHFGIDLPVDPAWVTVLISGVPLMYYAGKYLVCNKGISKITSSLLISIAMIAAIAIGDLFAAGEVAFIMALGGILEEVTTRRAKKGLNNLLRLAPTTARRIAEGKEEEISTDKICIGDLLRILPGETIPVDGVIVSGETSVDQSVMTGESLPVDKTVGEEVYCGTINRFGAVDVKATKVGEDSSLQKLIRMVQEAEEKKAPTARVADRAASLLVPAALLIAILTLIITRDIVRTVTVLVVFCPCALVLATPTAIMAAIGQATGHGVIIKSGEALENMGRVDTVAFDKTGTLTCGSLAVSDVLSFSERASEETVLTLAASAEAKSEHPLGKAIVAFAGEKEITPIESAEFKMSAGKGVYAEILGRRIFCGNEKFLEEQGVALNEETHRAAEEMRLQGKALILVAEGETCIGLIALSDKLRTEAAEVVKALSETGTNSVLLTGDNSRTAEYFASSAGVETVYASLLPEEKVEKITALQKANHRVCMVGDGVNDAPALKAATVGVAMGGMGSDIAVEAADVVLMRDDISRLPYLKRLSVATVKTIKFSITLSMVINILAVALSVLGVLNPTTGALVHNAGSCFVVLIAALLYDRKFS